MNHPMLFEVKRLTSIEGLFTGVAGIYNFISRKVTFKKLSEKGKLLALSKGFSPPLDLPKAIITGDSIPTQWYILEGETARPIFEMWCNCREEFFEEDLPVNGF